jgi:hypothetical protein
MIFDASCNSGAFANNLLIVAKLLIKLPGRLQLPP